MAGKKKQQDPPPEVTQKIFESCGWLKDSGTRGIVAGADLVLLVSKMVENIPEGPEITVETLAALPGSPIQKNEEDVWAADVYVLRRFLWRRIVDEMEAFIRRCREEVYVPYVMCYGGLHGYLEQQIPEVQHKSLPGQLRARMDRPPGQRLAFHPFVGHREMANPHRAEFHRGIHGPIRMS